MKTMSKKRTRTNQDSRITLNESVDTRPVDPPPKPRVTEFVPPPCNACSAVRPDGENHSRVYATNRGNSTITRYCRCGFCGNTYKVCSTT
jgi:hypothetical protein